ncbi:MAG: chemotaxis signal transduction protein [halophilic archaeon J07HB67]|jgi:Chemotaxis signal transduction protein|nr:MAG: chemotaxis signal transduction protein [halophilic archaeon J07HB67]
MSDDETRTDRIRRRRGDGTEETESDTEASDTDDTRSANTDDEPTSRAERLRDSREGGGGRADRISRGRSGRRDDTTPREPDESLSEGGDAASDDSDTEATDLHPEEPQTPQTESGESDETESTESDHDGLESGETGSTPGTEPATTAESDTTQMSTTDTARHEGAHPTEPFEAVEFRLAGETFALAIDYVEAIERLDDLATLTRVPGTPVHTLGVTAVRGQTTTVVDPDRTLGTASGVAEGDGERTVLVLDDDTLPADRQIAVLVERVRAVTTVDPETIADPPTPDAHVAGVIDRGDEFLVWVAPTFALGSA